MSDGAMLQSCLVVDDEADIRELLVMTLERMGLRATGAATLAEARHCLQQQDYALCLTDMRLPDGDGIGLMRYIFQHYPGMPVAVITAYGSAENAVAALKAGAFDYLAKPISLKQLRPLVQSALKLSESPRLPAAGLALVGESAPIQQVRAMIAKLARSQAPVYISGESGSGKELAARMVHGSSVRAEGPFVPVNCGAIPEALMESEFFGYRKGAFTGAQQDRPGFFQAASGGTLFLDEVADLPLPMQVKLLRAIQEKRVRMVGSTQEDVVDVRIISATHRNLAQMMERGQFRQDLYYRLNVIELKMPPLRQMPEDIPPLADAILRRQSHAYGEVPPRLSGAATALLMKHDFPGNVRELENILERALALSDGHTIAPADLLLDEMPLPAGGMPAAAAAEALPLPEYLEAVERQRIQQALAAANYNKTAAARLLGISFRALRYRLAKLGLGDEESGDELF